MLKSVAMSLNELKDDYSFGKYILAASRLSSDDFVVVFSLGKEDEMFDSQKSEEISEKVKTHLKEQIGRLPDTRPWMGLDLSVCTSRIINDPTVRLERSFYRAAKEASKEIEGQKEHLKKRNILELKEILDKGTIETLYQPIVNFKAKKIIGYEILSRDL